MCAGTLERASISLRSVWPNVKHFANEQSANLAQSAGESGFVRKSSQKADAVRKNSQKTDAAASNVKCAPPSSVPAQRKCQPRARHIANKVFGATASPNGVAGLAVARCCRRSFGTPVVQSIPERPPPSLTVDFPTERHHRPLRCGIPIEEIVRTASEKYQLNPDFWGKYQDIPAMAQAEGKEDILQIVDNFVVIHRKHVYLFQRLKVTILKNMASWSAPDLAALCHAWAQLGFLHEDLCIAMVERVAATAHLCDAQQLCWLMDAYATARCSVQSVVEEITRQTLLIFDSFSIPQLCLHASSFARLNIQHGPLFGAIAKRIVQAGPEDRGWLPPGSGVPTLAARDLTLAAYSFAKLGFIFPDLFEAIARDVLDVARDLTARDLQMLMVAFARARYRDPELLEALSLQAQRRIAQFSAESLVLTIRAMAFFDSIDSSFFTRAVAQLPRIIVTFRPVDVTTMLNSVAAVQVHSPALVDVVTPFILEKAPTFTPSDWLSALRGYASLGCKDAMFLTALNMHLEASKLTLHQLCVAILDCSKLSFACGSATLVEAASAKADADAAPLHADVAAQMYSALLLLGQSEDDRDADVVHCFLGNLARQLRHRDVLSTLSLSSCVNLCYAMLLAPPAGRCGDARQTCTGEHPVKVSALVERCICEAKALSKEERLLLQLSSRALELLPWNRCALRYAEQVSALPQAAAGLGPHEGGGTPTRFFAAMTGHTAPHLGEDEDRWLQRSSWPDHVAVTQGDFGARWRGVFVAREVCDGLAEVASALTSCGVGHRLVLDPGNVEEPHICVDAKAVFEAIGRPPGVAASRVDAEGVPWEIAVLWGSTLHYTSGPEKMASARPRMSPAAKFHMTLLQARVAEVVVIPHWWWPGRSVSSEEDRGRALLEFLGDQRVRAAAFSSIEVPGAGVAPTCRVE